MTSPTESSRDPHRTPEAPRPIGPLSRLVRAGVGLAVLAASIGIFLYLVRTRPMPEADAGSDGPRRVVTVEAFEAPVGRQWLGFGTVRPVEAAEVPARVTATVEELGGGYEVGRAVRRGEILVRLDDADFRRQLEISETALAAIAAERAGLAVDERMMRDTLALAEEELAIARGELERVRAAVAAEAAVEREIDRARSALLVAERAALVAREGLAKIPTRRQALDADEARLEASRALARLGLERCEIASPLDGFVQKAGLKVGESVVPGMSVARVVNVDRLEVPVLLAAAARGSVRPGDRVRIVPDRGGAVAVDGVVARIAPEDDPATRTMTVIVEDRDRASSGLAPGMFVTAEVLAERETVRTLVPRRSMNEGRLLVVRDGRIESREVEIEFTVTGGLRSAPVGDREWLVLRDPLPAGTTVVLDGSRRELRDGLAVTAVPAAPAVERATGAGR